MSEFAACDVCGLVEDGVTVLISWMGPVGVEYVVGAFGLRAAGSRSCDSDALRSAPTDAVLVEAGSCSVRRVAESLWLDDLEQILRASLWLRSDASVVMFGDAH